MSAGTKFAQRKAEVSFRPHPLLLLTARHTTLPPPRVDRIPGRPQSPRLRRSAHFRVRGARPDIAPLPISHAASAKSQDVLLTGIVLETAVWEHLGILYNTVQIVSASQSQDYFPARQAVVASEL